MKKGKDDKQSPGEIAESIYFLILPLLCIVSLLRGCGARSAQIPETTQTVSEQQYEAGGQEEQGELTGQAENSDPEETPGAEENIDPEQTSGSGENINPEQITGQEESTEPSERVVEPESGSSGSEVVTESSGSTGGEAVARQNPYDSNKFSYTGDDGQNITYQDENYESLQGIDVSDHQGEIDWKAVADAGYDFVFVRVGFRGYGDEGTLNEDTMAIEYMKDAEKAGLDVGAYFFSQAVNEEEAAEEARFAADVVKRSGVTLSLPLVYDPELAGGSAGRANNLSREQICSNALAFKKAAEDSIHCKVALYTNLYWENTYFDVETLNQFEIWYADYEPLPQTNYHFTWWQYSETGTVPGIKGAMDLNLWIKRVD